MARKDSDRLDECLDLTMGRSEAQVPDLDPRLAALLQLAGELRGLPSHTFKARLRAELLASADPALYGKALANAGDIAERLEELARGPRLAACDLDAARRDLPDMTMRFLASLNACTVGVSRFAGPSTHWERHPGGDELLHVLDGETDVVTLTDAGPVRSILGPGSLFICPQGLWHRLEPRAPGTVLFATPGEGTEHSSAVEPSPSQQTARAAAEGRADRPMLGAHDLRAVLRDLPELKITPETTEAEADAAVRPLAALGPCTLGVTRYSGTPPWERHPDGDELLHALDGAADITVLTDCGPVRTTLRAGSIFVCPRGLWHRTIPRPSVTLLFGTPTATGESSFADDPRSAR